MLALVFEFHFPPGQHNNSPNGDDPTDQLEHLRQDGEINHGTHQNKETPGGLDNHGAGSFNKTKRRVLGKARDEWSQQ